MKSIQIGNISIGIDNYKKIETQSKDDWKGRLLSIVESGANLDNVAASTTEWVQRYHLSSARKKLLSWYDYSNINSVLEIGSGCGALTGLLSENCRELICVDESLRRTQINATRHKDAVNINMLVGNIMELEIDSKFDLITIIGVYEYIAAIEKNRILFLENVRHWLNPNGKVLLAIENKYGLEYWAGYPEDHTGRGFDSLEGYPEKSEAITFSHSQLESLIIESGFSIVRFYYPAPDYKFPNDIFSDSRLPTEVDLPLLRNYRKRECISFDEERVIMELIKDGMFPLFANSFLIEAMC